MTSSGAFIFLVSLRALAFIVPFVVSVPTAAVSVGFLAPVVAPRGLVIRTILLVLRAFLSAFLRTIFLVPTIISVMARIAVVVGVFRIVVLAFVPGAFVLAFVLITVKALVAFRVVAFQVIYIVGLRILFLRARAPTLVLVGVVGVFVI